jgi:hypothetical protein
MVDFLESNGSHFPRSPHRSVAVRFTSINGHERSDMRECAGIGTTRMSRSLSSGVAGPVGSSGLSPACSPPAAAALMTSRRRIVRELPRTVSRPPAAHRGVDFKFLSVLRQARVGLQIRKAES